MNETHGIFSGTWKLLEWTAKLPDGKIIFPFGRDAIGRIGYDDRGNMWVQIMKAVRPAFKSEDIMKGEPEEMLQAYQDFFAYSGNYEVHPEDQQVIHKIKLSSFPNWIGHDQVRNYEFRGSLLILSANLESGYQRLVWEKFSS